jgi:hypothetical protein
MYIYIMTHKDNEATKRMNLQRKEKGGYNEQRPCFS